MVSCGRNCEIDIPVRISNSTLAVPPPYFAVSMLPEVVPAIIRLVKGSGSSASWTGPYLVGSESDSLRMESTLTSASASGSRPVLISRAAAEYLGAEYACAGLQDLEVFTNAENVRRVVELMRAFDPDVVLTHSPVDYMLDHEETSRLARTASFGIAAPLYETRHVPPAPPARATPALYYADPIEGVDPLGDRVNPHFYVDITRQIEKKRRMLSCHVSQRDWLRDYHGMDEYLGRMTEWAAVRGGECGFAYAEGLRQHLGHHLVGAERIAVCLGAALEIGGALGDMCVAHDQRRAVLDSSSEGARPSWASASAQVQFRVPSCET